MQREAPERTKPVGKRKTNATCCHLDVDLSHTVKLSVNGNSFTGVRLPRKGAGDG